MSMLSVCPTALSRSFLLTKSAEIPMGGVDEKEKRRYARRAEDARCEQGLKLCFVFLSLSFSRLFLFGSLFALTR